MLAEVEKVFTGKDNKVLLSMPQVDDVKKVVSAANHIAAPGTDGILSLLYHTYWDIIGQSLTEVIQAIHKGDQPTPSMRTSLMVIGSKPKKPHSIKPGDKKRISLLNSDFKVVTAI